MHRHHRHRSELGHEDDDRDRERRGDEHEQQDAGSLTAQPRGQRSFAGGRIGFDIAQVVEDKDRRREKSHPASHQDAERGDSTGLHINRADRRHEAEEEEDEDLAQAEVAVWSRPPRVQPAREQARRADDQQPPVDGQAESDPQHGGDAEGGDRRPPDLRRSDNPRRSGANGPDSPVVGAAHEVRVVVGEIDPDLHAERDHQSGKAGGPMPVTLMNCNRRPREHGRDRGRQRCRSHGRPPDSRGAQRSRGADHYGRFGNFAKFGLRFCT